MWNLAVCWLVILGMAGSLLMLWRRAVANEECINCRRSMGLQFEHKLTRVEPPYYVYRKYRVCRHCGSRTLLKEYYRRQKLQKDR